MSYYFVINSFPQLTLGLPPQMSYEEVRQMLLMNLNARDLEQLKRFQLLTDFRNIRALWLSQSLDLRGNLNEKELQEDLLVRSFLPPYVGDFLDRYESPELRLRYFTSLYVSLYADFEQNAKGFLAEIIRIEREVKLCLTLLRVKRLGGDLTYELQFEDLFDPFVMQLLVQKEGKEALLPQEYEDLKTIFSDNVDRPKELYLAANLFRMRKIEELEQANPFGPEQIFGYLARLLIVEDCAGLDYHRGRSALNQLCV